MLRPSLLQRIKMKMLEQQSKGKESITKKVGKKIDENIKSIKQLLGEPTDLVVRELMIGGMDKRAAIVYISGITDEQLINNNILKTIQLNIKPFESNILEKIEKEVIAITDIEKSKNMEDISLAVLNGNTAFFMDGSNTVLLIGTTGGENRSIMEPESETLIRGPKEGFTENLVTNLAMIRKDIKDPRFRIKEYKVGNISKQKLVLCYIDGITNPQLVEELNRRIETVDIDFISDTSFIEQWIEDDYLSPFPQLLDTERPDRVSNFLVEGKVAILLEGTPFALLAPITIGDALISIEDYTQRWISATLLRLLRYLAAFLALFLPALYVALVSYHPGMIPSTLAFSIAATREGVPFPAAIEAMLMAITFEILHEAGIRLPKVIGQTIGIVGGLVIGDAAVSAGIVSPVMVIVTALTAIASFSVPSYSVAISFRTLRFGLMLAAAFLGLYGIILAYIMVNIHLVNLKSIGIPYTTPFAPTFLKDFRDLIIRVPITKLQERSNYLKTVQNQSEDNMK